jgi:predicted NAD/FAD-binding protein
VKIAVVGTGIAGMVAALRLHCEHDLTVYEAGAWIGGHTNTVEIQTGDGPLAVDTGFIVFNRKTYPKFCALLEELGVPSSPTTMSFSVRCEREGLEYNGTSLNGLFAQRRNALRPSFWRMVRDILRFYREAPALLTEGGDDLTLGEFLERGRYSREFMERHMLPMGAAIWSARTDRIREFPVRFLVQFFHNHGFLQVDDRPQWLVVRGGSREYVRALVAPFRDRIRLETPVVSVEPTSFGLRVRTATGDSDTYDRVVLACHADQSLRMLSDPTPTERSVLGAFSYQRNEAVLHTDRSLLPRNRRAWASWNYHVSDPPSELPTVTYWMNGLQGFRVGPQILVTLNRTRDIDPSMVLGNFVYHHPIYSTEAVRAQRRHGEIDGIRGVHYCGAYWGFGFHEDGVASGLRVAERILSEVAA